MDPTENYRRQIKIALAIMQQEADGDINPASALGAELAELVLALHDWRGNGGAEPKFFK